MSCPELDVRCLAPALDVMAGRELSVKCPRWSEIRLTSNLELCFGPGFKRIFIYLNYP